jgi:trk system potassium uptake protein TrkH
VWGDIVKHKHHIKAYSFHSKIVLSTTAALIVVGWLLFAIFEWNNEATIGNLDVGSKILASLFMSVSPRTAGFNTVEMASLTNSGSLLTLVLMFIGGSPGSTAGGIKTTTLAVFLLCAVATSKRYSETHIFKRRVENEAYHQAGVVVALYVTLIIISALAIGGLEEGMGYSFDAILFEVVSATGTVGLSYGITAQLHILSKIILILLMYFGRVGGYTLILVFSNERKPVKISRVPDRLIIG